MCILLVKANRRLKAICCPLLSEPQWLSALQWLWRLSRREHSCCRAKGTALMWHQTAVTGQVRSDHWSSAVTDEDGRSATQPEPFGIHRGHSWHFAFVTLREIFLCGNTRKYLPAYSVLNSHKHCRAEADHEVYTEIEKKITCRFNL